MSEYPAIRYSSGTDPRQTRDGLIKLYLGHSARGSVVVPAQLFVRAGPWRFFQSSFFGPCILGFNVEPALHRAELSVDVASPRGGQSTRLLVQFSSDQRIRVYDDGAQLYRCVVEGPKNLAHYSAGRCTPLADDDFGLQLFHHTNPTAYASIASSREFWSSSWNLQGTRELKNVSYVYFTSVPKIESDSDLMRIAMASTGEIQFQTTSERRVEEVLKLSVYRESTAGRPNTLAIQVPSAALAPPHLLFHPMARRDPAYYEVVSPEIFRVGLLPGATLAIPRNVAAVVAPDLKTFDYIVMGDASEVAGLAAPYDEEETKQVMHIERLASGMDLFEFWLSHANSDQITGRKFEPRDLGPAA